MLRKIYIYFPFMLGGQCILAVDVPGPPASEEQQGSFLSAALETQTPNPAQRRPDQGNVFLFCLLVFLFNKAFYPALHCCKSPEVDGFAPGKVVTIQERSLFVDGFSMFSFVAVRLWQQNVIYNVPLASLRWSRRTLRSTPRSLSRRIVWASPRLPRFDLNVCYLLFTK